MRLRKLIASKLPGYKLSGEVEMDESYFEGRRKGKRGRGAGGKVAVFGLLKRGMLEDTLVVWSGEFGRTPMRENRNGFEMSNVGRDHSPSAFTMWMAGGGVKAGFTYGETDSLGYDVAVDKVSAHDF